jgi:hypothetical protein
VGTGLKVALMAAAVVAAVVLLVVLRPGDEDDEAEQTTPTTTVTETRDETTTTEEKVVRAEIVVQGGDVSGPAQVELEQGQRLVLACAPMSPTRCMCTATTSWRTSPQGSRRASTSAWLIPVASTSSSNSGSNS